MATICGGTNRANTASEAQSEISYQDTLQQLLRPRTSCQEGLCNPRSFATRGFAQRPSTNRGLAA